MKRMSYLDIEKLIGSLRSVWDYFKTADKPIILYGMGDGADKVLSRFYKLGIKPRGVMASDDFVRGQRFHDFTVKKLSDFESELGDFTVALCFASQLPDVMSHIEYVSEKHPLFVPSVPVFGENTFDREFVLANENELKKAYSLLADDMSRRVFEDIISFQYSGDLKYLKSCTTDKDEAFSILNLGGEESYLDLGAYNGDTIEEFLGYTGGKYKSITAFEPNAKSFKKLSDYCADMENVSLWNLGSYNKNTVIKFNTKSGRNCAIDEKGTPVQAARVDTILCGKRITYAKLDVEGAERETFEGMENTIKLFKPKLNVAAYHRSEDIFALILQLYSLNPDYKFYLRHHPYIPHWDTNLYCV
ncbi:MAG: FkbM family methyltransferase [Ruminococcus sp.]|nr:FkbM family methyltransferase [Ruminococcus sp.]